MMEGQNHVCPECGEHFYMTASERIALLCDEGSFEPLFEEVVSEDILGFNDQKPYSERIKSYQKKTGQKSAAVVGESYINRKKVAFCVLDFGFMGGSLGRSEGERITRCIEHATKNRLPLVIVSASGGARMQESTYSLMQMAKTSAALKRHSEKGLFYISVLTHPTTGGVLASFAFLGDVVIAEPKALIGFTGPRVIEQTIGEKLKSTDQKSEFQLEAGMIDQIVPRHELKSKISYFIEMFSK